MNRQSILVVDDEKSVRLMLTNILEPLGHEVKTAVNGEDALKRLAEEDFDLILLDLRMPGMDGLTVLQRVTELRPDIQVVIVSAYGTIECAVEAIKRGAADFIQKPFAPQEIRKLVARVLDPQKVAEKQTIAYQTHLERARLNMNRQQLRAAMEHVKQAIGLDPTRPEAFNLLGALYEVQQNLWRARIYYRLALELDSRYHPARRNLSRLEEDSREA